PSSIVSPLSIGIFLRGEHPGIERGGKRSIEIGPCTLLVIFPFISEPTMRVGSGISWIEADRLVEIGDRSVIIALVVVCDAALVVSENIFRIEPDCLVVISN